MTTPVELSDFLGAYLGEADEHLTSANTLLLEIEARARRAEPVARQVRELFRALHTIKGLSAMVGVDPIVEISHRMETVLRTADRSGGRLPRGSVDLLLQGTRAIEQRVRALHEGATPADPPRALLEALDALDADDDEPRVVRGPVVLQLDDAVSAKLGPVEHELLTSGLGAGKRALSIRFAPSTAHADRGITINSVRERVGALGEIVKVVPLSVPRSAEAPAGLAFAIVVLTTQSIDALVSATGLDPSAIALAAAPAPPALERVPGEKASPSLPPLDDDSDAALPSDDLGRRAGVVRVEVARLDDTLERLSALVVGRFQWGREITRLAESGVDVRGLRSLAREQARQLRDLRGSILGLRMVPLTDVLDRVPLILRGLRRTTKKAVRLEVDVGRAELDKAVAERIFPAIVHLLRNAVDHGIEAPAERAQAGKAEEGSLRIECSAVGNGQMELRITDDGRGIDRAALARRADAPLPETDAQTLQLLCRPGLSTRDEASDTSGRGMGMDIVRRIVVDQLGGQLSLTSEPGVGTTFALRVPLTISIVDAFTFECGSQRFAVPLSTIDEIVDIQLDKIVQAPSRGTSTAEVGVVERRGHAVSVVRLDAVLGMPTATLPALSKGLVVKSEANTIAFVVDRMLGQQEIVVRALGDPLVTVPGIAGATDLGDGRPTLILDLMSLSSRHLASHVAARRTSSSAGREKSA